MRFTAIARSVRKAGYCVFVDIVLTLPTVL